MTWIIPFIGAACFRLGGGGFVWPYKWWRWLILGLIIGAICHNYWVVITYFLATQVPYGSSSSNWLRKWLTADQNWVVYGLLFGLASMPILGPFLVILQGILGAVTFWLLMCLSNYGVDNHYPNKWYLDHKYVEIGIGFMGTVLYWLK